MLAIGGLKEKALAAFRRGVKTVIIPEANKKDLADIPAEVSENLRFVTVRDVDEVFKEAVVGL